MSGSPLETNVVALDRRGNVLQRIDAAGNVFTNAFDGLNRLKIAAGPPVLSITLDCGDMPVTCTNYVTNVVQQIETTSYDYAGINTTNADALGDMTVRTRDALGRVTLAEAFGPGSSTPVRVIQNAYSLDNRYVTRTDGSNSLTISTQYAFDNDGRVLMTSRYPASDVVEFTVQSYDLAGNQVQAAQCSSSNGTVTVWSTNSWNYDGLNRKTEEITRDGATTVFGYNGFGDLTSRSMPGGLTWDATYNTAGQILTENDSSGGQSTRNFTNTYNLSGPFAGLLNTAADSRGVTQTNSYDDYLRVVGVGTSGSLAAQQMSCAWQYDVRGFVTNITQSFANTNTGPTTIIGRQFDAYGQILSESDSLGTTISQGWDAAGRRIQSGGQLFQYQADGRIIGVNGSTFGFGDDGLLTGRTNSSRAVVVNSRDGEGKLLRQTTTANSSTVLTENWSWTGDDLPVSYAAARTDYTDSRQFTYGTATRRLTQETFNLNGSQSVTNNYTYDGGTAAGLGVLTAAGEGSNSWSGSLDAFSRISTETNSIIHRTANGNVNGAATLRGYLNGQPLNVTYDPHAASVWYADIALSAGTSNTLSIYADHPSGLFTTNQNSTFTVAAGAFDSEQSQYDGSGNVTNRVWKRADGTVVRTQSLTWDAFGNLVNVTDLDGTNNGYNIVSVFDGLGRQVQTIETTISNNVALVTNPAPVVVTYAYDPQVGFLIEYVGITQGSSSRQDWFAYGPDISTRYGGMHGIGGLDTISTTVGPLNTTAAVINDAFGNVIGAITNSVLAWNASRESLYAPVEGYAPPRLSLDAPAFASVAWRTRPLNAVGFVQLGMRPYDPVRRAFMSADPLGHDADAGLNTAFGGNPAAFFDPDGRDWHQQYQNSPYPTLGFDAPPGYVPDYINGGITESYESRLLALWAEYQGSPEYLAYIQSLNSNASGNPIANYFGGIAYLYGALADETDNPYLGASLDFVSSLGSMGQRMTSPSAYIAQAAYDYDAAGGGITGVLGVVNRYNPTKPFYEVASGIDLNDGHELSGVERTSAGLNAFGTVLLGSAGVLNNPGTFAESGTIDPSLVRFTQDSISPNFKNGSSISDLVDALNGPDGADVASQVPPIRLVQQNGLLYTLDNRRLAAFSMTDFEVPYVMATPEEIAAEWTTKFTTTPEQGMGQFITVRPPKGWVP